MMAERSKTSQNPPSGSLTVTPQRPSVSISVSGVWRLSVDTSHLHDEAGSIPQTDEDRGDLRD